MKRERLSIDVLPEEHKAIKSYAAAHGKSIKDIVLEALYEKIKIDMENKDINDITSKFGSSFSEVWDNEEDVQTINKKIILKKLGELNKKELLKCIDGLKELLNVS